jgi:hypothetical protein
VDKAHPCRLWNAACQSVCPAGLYSAELNGQRIEYLRGAQALKPVFRRLIPAALLAGSILISCPALSFAQSRTVKLNENAFAFAKELITQGRAVVDKKNSWRDHHPMAEAENEFIRVHGFAEYRKWYLGIDETHAEDTKARYKFPFGDLTNLHRCGLLAVKSRAHQFGYADIEKAAIQLIEIVNSKEQNQSRRARKEDSWGQAAHRLAVCAPSGSYTPLKRTCHLGEGLPHDAQAERLCSDQESQLPKNASINSGRSSL